MLFCMRVMVGVIILYDHVHPVGAFAKTSKIDVSAFGFGFRGVGRGFCVLIGPSDTCR